MSRNGILALLVLATFLSLPTKAHALSLSLVGTAVDGLVDHADSSGVTTQGRVGYGGGALIGAHLLPRLAFETGGLYLVNRYHLINGASTQNTTRYSVYVPADLRLYFNREVSISGGAYYNHFTQSGLASDYGWEAGLRWMLGRHWFLEGRYSQGIKDYGGFRYSNVLGLLGLHLGAL